MSRSDRNKTLLEMNQISKEFPGVKALDKATFHVKKGTVHALMGENGAGKSTLMKVLFGIYQQDRGEILLDGSKCTIKNSKHALDVGISMVHQELNQVKQRNILDNIWLGRYPKKRIFIDEVKMFEDTINIFKRLEIDLDPQRLVSTLSVSEMQMVEIAKAVSHQSKIIVMDEPTSSLTEKEVNHLFRIIKKLLKEEVSVIYISHKIEEILQISDEITIMRDGQTITTRKASEIGNEEIISLMVGRELENRFPPKKNVPKDIILEVSSFSSIDSLSFQNITFELRKGEILGIAGLVGSKRTELLEAMFGLRHHSSGTIKLNGRIIENNTPRKAMKNGLALVTEERRSTGIFPMLDISFNSTVANMKSYRNSFGLLSHKMISKDTNWVVQSMSVKTPSASTLLLSLSGGNQQKVVIGRWLLTKPEVFLLDEPTRGIDVGAKYEIYQLIQNLALEEKGIIVISSEMPELLGITDRILVMNNGKAAGILETKNATQEQIMTLAASI